MDDSRTEVKRRSRSDFDGPAPHSNAYSQHDDRTEHVKIRERDGRESEPRFDRPAGRRGEDRAGRAETNGLGSTRDDDSGMRGSARRSAGSDRPTGTEAGRPGGREQDNGGRMVSSRYGDRDRLTDAPRGGRTSRPDSWNQHDDRGAAPQPDRPREDYVRESSRTAGTVRAERKHVPSSGMEGRQRHAASPSRQGEVRQRHADRQDVDMTGRSGAWGGHADRRDSSGAARDRAHAGSDYNRASGSMHGADNEDSRGRVAKPRRGDHAEEPAREGFDFSRLGNRRSHLDSRDAGRGDAGKSRQQYDGPASTKGPSSWAERDRSTHGEDHQRDKRGAFAATGPRRRFGGHDDRVGDVKDDDPGAWDGGMGNPYAGRGGFGAERDRRNGDERGSRGQGRGNGARYEPYASDRFGGNNRMARPEGGNGFARPRRGRSPDKWTHDLFETVEAQDKAAADMPAQQDEQPDQQGLDAGMAAGEQLEEGEEHMADAGQEDAQEEQQQQGYDGGNGDQVEAEHVHEGAVLDAEDGEGDLLQQMMAE